MSYLGPSSLDGPLSKNVGHRPRLVANPYVKLQKESNNASKLPKIKGLDEDNKDLNLGIEIGVFSAQGRRPYQEDEYAIYPLLNRLVGSGENVPETHLFAVFDGHAGGKCSKTVSLEFPENLCKDQAFKSKLTVALRNAFQKTNEQFLKVAERMRLNDGSTGIVIVLRGKRMIIGNVGDSRAVLVTGRKAVQLSIDHKPSSPEEMRRISALGGSVINCMGVPRVNGILAVARAFGNYGIRHVIKADPDITQREISPEDDFLVLASDGLWDVLRNKDVSDTCYSLRAEGLSAQRIAEELVRTALNRGSMDNVTCLVVNISGYLSRVESQAIDADDEKDDAVTPTVSASPVMGPGHSPDAMGSRLNSSSGPLVNESHVFGKNGKGSVGYSNEAPPTIRRNGGSAGTSQTRGPGWNSGPSDAYGQGGLNGRSAAPYSGFAQPRGGTAGGSSTPAAEYGEKRPATVGPSTLSTGHGGGRNNNSRGGLVTKEQFLVDFINESKLSDNAPLSRTMPVNGGVGAAANQSTPLRRGNEGTAHARDRRRDLNTQSNSGSGLSQSLYIGRAVNSSRNNTPQHRASLVDPAVSNTTGPTQLFSRTKIGASLNRQQY